MIGEVTALLLFYLMPTNIHSIDRVTQCIVILSSNTILNSSLNRKMINENLTASSITIVRTTDLYRMFLIHWHLNLSFRE